jgi:DNA-binding transcriptional ArsR family regulator
MNDTLPVAELEQVAEQVALFLRSLANRDRLLLLCHLIDGERTVGALEEATGIRQPSLSQQLGVLREEGLVDTRREGRFVHYRIASAEASELLGVLYRQFCAPAPAGRRAPRKSLQET